jgi:hypothetical protein
MAGFRSQTMILTSVFSAAGIDLDCIEKGESLPMTEGVMEIKALWKECPAGDISAGKIIDIRRRQ